MLQSQRMSFTICLRLRQIHRVLPWLDNRISPGTKFLLHRLAGLWYNDLSQKACQLNGVSRKANPRRDSRSPGVLLCLLALAVPVKPLANIVANYTRCDRHKECLPAVHEVSPPSHCWDGEGQQRQHSILPSKKQQKLRCPNRAREDYT